jgi:hypothetical protein
MTLSMEHPYFRLPKPFSIVELIFSFQYFQSGTYKIIGIKPGTSSLEAETRGPVIRGQI